jgi:beta-glucanase (GH16 family)
MTSDHRFGKDATEFQVLEKFAQKYGWFETRCKSIKGSGLYTAFWLHQTDPTDQEYTPQGKPKQAGDGVVEIDIFELLGRDAAAGDIDVNVQFPKEGGGGHYRPKMGFDPSEDFHIYAMEWQEVEINWYVDIKKVQTYKGDTPQKKMFILLALFHGAHPGWVGNIPENQTYPIVFEVDYVRVYQKE